MVTQVTGTYADLYSWDNLYAAYCKAAKGKRRCPAYGAAGAGPHRLDSL